MTQTHVEIITTQSGMPVVPWGQDDNARQQEVPDDGESELDVPSDEQQDSSEIASVHATPQSTAGGGNHRDLSGKIRGVAAVKPGREDASSLEESSSADISDNDEYMLVGDLQAPQSQEMSAVRQQSPPECSEDELARSSLQATKNRGASEPKRRRRREVG